MECHTLDPDVIDMSLQPHKVGGRHKVFVDKPRATVGDDGLGHQVFISMINRVRDGHETNFVGKERGDVDVSD